MSAYSKTCSRVIYAPDAGENESFVTKQRLLQMLNHEYALLVKRGLDDEKPKYLRYFVFANSIAIDRDGWAGIRVQADGNAAQEPDSALLVHDYYLHFNILGQDKIDKIRVVGALGVSLIYGALLNATVDMHDMPFVRSLMDGYDRSGIRIDSLEVRTLSLEINESIKRAGDYDVTLNEVVSHSDDDNRRSRKFGVELVRCGAVRCSTFRRPVGGASIAYHVSGESSEESSPLLITRSAARDGNAEFESAMLRNATEQMQIDRRDKESGKIQTSVQIPIFSARCIGELSKILKKKHPYKQHLHQPSLYVGISDVPREYTEEYLALLLNSTNATETIKKIDAVTSEGHIAMLSEFFATSELVKYIRNRSRLTMNRSDGRDLGFVFRIDQFLAGLLTLKTYVRDREPLEVITNLVRRKATIYLYPCTARRLLESTTDFGDQVSTSLRPETVNSLTQQEDRIIELSDLLTDNFTEQVTLMRYLANNDRLRGVAISNSGENVSDYALATTSPSGA